MNEPKQTQQQIDGWAQLTLLDPAPIVQVRPTVIRSALRCPLCGAALVHVIGSGLCDCPRCGAVFDL
jgi:hypothetical protein